jgi:hypothetical protein
MVGGTDKRHHVPAACIGYFSETPKAIRRKSMVAVHRFVPDVNFMARAENVGFSRDIYRGSPFPEGGWDNDNYLATFENMAHKEVDRIGSSPSGAISANDWIRVAAYVTSQFARAPDLELSLDILAEEMGMSRENMDVGYLMNLPRVGSAVLRARWEFVRSPSIDFILNDRAIAGIRYGDWDSFGYFIPLRKRFGIRLAGGPFPKQITRVNGEWKIKIPIVELEDFQVDQLNRWTWCGAVAEVYGPSIEHLDHVRAQVSSGSMWDDVRELARKIEGASLLTLSNSQRVADEWLLLSLLGGIREPEQGIENVHLSV